MQLSVPGKTFLVGEYLALSGGPSVLLATGPRFTLEAKLSNSVSENPWHPHSPAGFYWNREKEKFKNVSLTFHDPHQGQGGLGASSAQWALLYSYLHYNELATAIDLESMLRLYRVCAWNGIGEPPSGHDVVAQIFGEVTEFDGRSYAANAGPWPFTDLAFTLIRTGSKLATHEHLKTTPVVPRERLRSLVQDARTALKQTDSSALSKAVDEYGCALAEAGFLAERSRELIEELRRLNEKSSFAMTAVKGCGAMGADLILVLHAPSGREAILVWAQKNNLTVASSESDLESGLEIDGRKIL